MKTHIPLDSSMSPENAEERGYEWRSDIYYDPEAPKEVLQEFIDLAKEGFVLGEAASRTKGKSWYGLYQPLDK